MFTKYVSRKNVENIVRQAKVKMYSLQTTAACLIGTSYYATAHQHESAGVILAALSTLPLFLNGQYFDIYRAHAAFLRDGESSDDIVMR